jgi:hypothetical protein
MLTVRPLLLVVPGVVAVTITILAPTVTRATQPGASAQAAAVVARPCFGAAARNPLVPCVDLTLRLTVFPTPDDAVLEPWSPCTPQPFAGLMYPCAFGAGGSQKPAAIALIGDSHAGHWRAAIDVVARAAGAPAVSITRTGCPLSKAEVVMATRDQAATCRRWNRDVLTWLAQHPEVSTVFLSQRAGARYATRRGASNFDTAVHGDAALYRALPATVKSVIVIRDTPLDSTVAEDCVRRAITRGRPAGTRCARSRAAALRRDPAVTAARRVRGRVHVIDMSPFFCSSARCYPVVGGALVHKDVDHITTVFSRTLGPFMVSKVATIVANARSLGRGARDGQQLVARGELHAWAPFAAAAMTFVRVDRPPAVGADEVRDARGKQRVDLVAGRAGHR